MKLGIIHLTDCHIADGTEPFLKRVTEIAATVRGFKRADSWAIVFSGDITNAGTASQVEIGMTFLTQLKAAVSHITGAETQMLVVPGNHDCHIPSEEARQAQTSMIRSGNLAEKEALLAAQSSFWAAFPPPGSPSCNSKLAFVYEFRANAESVALVGINSSWMSDLHEEPGGIQFKPEWFDPVAVWIYQNEPDVVITAIHHPVHWQREGIQKPLWHKLNKVTDLLLTGHEHHADDFIRQKGLSSISVFEGGVLSHRELGYDHSNFQILYLDTQQRAIESAVCVWSSSRGEFALQRAQHQYRQNTGRVKNALREEWLVDIESSLLEACHPRKNPVRLSDYFVWPHMRWIDKTKPTEPKLKTQTDVLELLAQKKYVRITGAIKAGKSCILRQMIPLLKQKGYTPILLDGAACEAADKSIKAALAHQYVDLTMDTLHAANNIIVLLDNWERVRLRLEKRLELLEELMQVSSFCILTTSVSTDVEYLASGRTSMLDAFQELAIEPLSRSKRSELLHRWASLAAPLELEDSELERAVEQGNDKISTILGENLIPATPITTLMLWRELESGVGTTQGVGSSGHLYKHLIEYSLTHSQIKASEIGWDQRYSFLAFLAHAMFKKKAPLSRSEVKSVKDAFTIEVCLQTDMDAIVEDCCKIGILKDKDDAICFAFEFALYYFMAYYLHEHKEAEASQIDAMVDNLYAFENMQTIIFYLYLSSDAPVMMRILDLAGQFQNTAEEFKFEHLPEASRTLSDAVQPKLITERIEERPSFEMVVTNSKNHNAEVRDILLARRLSYVLGQVVCNFPAKVATRVGAERRDKFLKEAYRLELVALANSMKLLAAHADEFLEHIRFHISHDRASKLTKYEQDEMLRRAIPALLHYMVVQSVVEIPSRLCSKDLISVHDKIAEANGSKNRIYTVINTAIRIDQSSAYPVNIIKERADEFARAGDGSWDVLRDVVFRSLMKFKRIYRVRQQMCQEFDIKEDARLLLDEG